VWRLSRVRTLDVHLSHVVDRRLRRRHLTRKALGDLERGVADPGSKGARPAAEFDHLGVGALIDTQRAQAAPPHERENARCNKSQRNSRCETKEQESWQSEKERAWRVDSGLAADVQELVQLVRSQVGGVRR
jgi:hypothetical protein